MLSCKDFRYNLSKDLIVYRSLSYCFLFFLYLLMVVSYITLLPIDKPHAAAVDIGIAIKPTPVRLKVIKLDVVAIITNVSNDFSIVVNVLYFLYFFLDLLFLSLEYAIISLMLLIWLLKLLTSFFSFLIFVLNQDFSYRMVRLGTIYHIFVPLIWYNTQKITPICVIIVNIRTFFCVFILNIHTLIWVD